MSNIKVIKKKRTRIIFVLLALYLLFQLVWWVLHLLDLHSEMYRLQMELNQTDVEALSKTFRKKIMMVVGEGVVFISLLFFGITQLNKHQKKEADRANQQKNFVLAVTHELRTPLATIRLFLDTLRKRELPREKKVELIDDANQETHRLDQLVENILLSNRLEQSASHLHLETLDLTELVNSTLVRLHARLLPRHKLNKDLQQGVMLSVDRMSIESLLINLYENALKYGGEGLLINVSLKNHHHQAELIMEDQGPGIPVDQSDRIFDKFYRIGNEETRSAKGTGIGLYMVKQIVLAHGGKIHVEPNEPKGARFVIRIPNGF